MEESVTPANTSIPPSSELEARIQRELRACEARLEMSLKALSTEVSETKTTSGNQNQSINLALSSQRIFFAIFVAVAAYVGFQTYALSNYQRQIRTEFQQLLAEERKAAEKIMRVFPWELRIRGAIEDLAFSEEKWRREKAIYDTLKPALQSNYYDPHYRSIRTLVQGRSTTPWPKDSTSRLLRLISE